MASAEEWARLGRENLHVAQRLQENQQWRSCISRAYYSAMASSHAILMQLGQQPPDRGNWSNERLPAMLFAVLKAIDPRDGGWVAAAKSIRLDLGNLWMFRLQADYRPAATINELLADEAVKCARRLARQRERLA